MDPKAWGILHVRGMDGGSLEQILIAGTLWYPLPPHWVPLVSAHPKLRGPCPPGPGALPWSAREPQSPCATAEWLGDISCKGLRSSEPSHCSSNATLLWLQTQAQARSWGRGCSRTHVTVAPRAVPAPLLLWDAPTGRKASSSEETNAT